MGGKRFSYRRRGGELHMGGKALWRGGGGTPETLYMLHLLAIRLTFSSGVLDLYFVAAVSFCVNLFGILNPCLLFPLYSLFCSSLYSEETGALVLFFDDLLFVILLDGPGDEFKSFRKAGIWTQGIHGPKYENSLFLPPFNMF